MKHLPLALAFFLFISCKKKIDYAAYKSSQDYSIPLWKDNQENKSALFVFPHPDDEIVCGGNIDQLKQKGWNVNLLTLTQGEKTEKEVRLKEWNRAGDILGFNNRDIYDLVNNTWDDVLKNKIEFWYNHTDSIENIISRSITKYQPSVIFTYDTALGGYGHPEHRISALAVYQLFEKHKSDSLFPVQEILQITLPEKYEQLKFASSEAYANAKKYTGNTTLPEPTVAFDIRQNWSVKSRAGSAYESQAETLRKFFLLPDPDDTISHFTTFDREYYFEIKR